MSIEIKRIDGTVAYESQSATSLKEAVAEAVRQGHEFWHDRCGAPALLVLEPLAPGAGVES